MPRAISTAATMKISNCSARRSIMPRLWLIDLENEAADSGKRRSDDLRVALRKAHEPHLAHRVIARQCAPYRGHGDARRLVLRVAVGAGGDRREREGLEAVARGEGDRVLVARGEKLRVPRAVLAVDGSHRMDDMLRAELSSRRDDGLAGGQSARVARLADAPALGEDLRAAGP